jgi:hypothetical protein
MGKKFLLSFTAIVTVGLAAVPVSAAPFKIQESKTSNVNVHLLQCSRGYYKNTFGRCVKTPTVAPQAPMGATAKCWDGSYSFSQSQRGTCSHHGGVSRWL